MLLLPSLLLVAVMVLVVGGVSVSGDDGIVGIVISLISLMFIIHF